MSIPRTELYNAYGAWELTKKRLKEMDEIISFFSTDECYLINAKVKESAQSGSFIAVLDKKDFNWNYDMIYKSFTDLGYKVEKDECGDIVLDWENGWKNYYGKTTKRMK